MQIIGNVYFQCNNLFGVFITIGNSAPEHE